MHSWPPQWDVRAGSQEATAWAIGGTLLCTGALLPALRKAWLTHLGLNDKQLEYNLDPSTDCLGGLIQSLTVSGPQNPHL